MSNLGYGGIENPGRAPPALMIFNGRVQHLAYYGVAAVDGDTAIRPVF